jgi:hypothetical protein
MQVVHRHRVIRALILLAMLGSASRVHAAPAHAAPDPDSHVPELTRELSSTSEKTRLSAVLALAKLGDHAVMKPLIQALHDTNAQVRAVAATALGRLACDDALAALRELAANDDDANVRTAASNAVIKISQAPHPAPAAEPKAEARRTTASARADAGEPHTARTYLLLNSSDDQSPGNFDKATRKLHADLIRRTLADQMRHEPTLTTVEADAKKWSLPERHIDLSVTKIDAYKTGGMVEVHAELRIAISDDHGKMMSFLSGGAKVQVPADKFDASYLPTLRQEVLETAMRGMFSKLLAYLRSV